MRLQGIILPIGTPVEGMQIKRSTNLKGCSRSNVYIAQTKNNKQLCCSAMMLAMGEREVPHCYAHHSHTQALPLAERLLLP